MLLGRGDPDAMSDVKVSDCSGDNEFGTMMLHATVTFTNSTDRTQSYMVTVGVNDPSGARPGEINTVSNLAGRWAIHHPVRARCHPVASRALTGCTWRRAGRGSG